MSKITFTLSILALINTCNAWHLISSLIFIYLSETETIVYNSNTVQYMNNQLRRVAEGS